MNSNTTIILLICFSFLIGLIIHSLSARLRNNFPPLPIWRGVLWYRWKSQPSAEAMAFSPFTGVIFPHRIIIRAKSAWLCFILHLLFTCSMVLWGQYKYSEEKHNCPNPTPPTWCGWSNQLDMHNYVAILGTFLFIILRIFQTHVWYDGLALDIPEASSMAAVVIALSLSLLMHQTERGLMFGFSLQHETLLLLTNIARRYHGYVFTFTAVFTFWYHPAEGGVMHLPGFFMVILILFQGCLMFTTSHLNTVWRTLLELLILPHTLLVERVRTHRDLWKMFLSGYVILFLTSQMHAFHISFRAKCGLFFSAVLILYCLYSHSLRALFKESIRIPITYYIFVVIFYFALYIPYSILSLLGYWPESKVMGTLNRDFHPSLIICAITLVLTTIILIGFVGEFFEGKLRSLATKAGSADDKIISIFEDPSTKPKIRKVPVLPKITIGELRKHNQMNDAWVAIHNVVYDVTDFIKFHPGSSALLLRYCGGDGSVVFDSVRGNQGHPRLIRERMRSLACGVIHKE